MIDPDYQNKSTKAIEKLRKMVENKDYIDAAIERIALVLSDEILDCGNYKEGGRRIEQFRKRRK